MVDNVHFSTGNDEWETPNEIFDPLHKEFDFTIDAAASDLNHKLPRYWTEEDDSLTTDWKGERVWINPPYSRPLLGQFIKKAATSGADLVCMLVPARTDTKAWHDHIFNVADEIRFMRGRIKFLLDGKVTNSAPFPSAIVIWRPRSYACVTKVTTC